MNPKYKYLIKNTGILAISNFSSKLLVFFLVPLYTGVLTPKEYGIFDIISSTVALLIPLLTLNIVSGVMLFSMDSRESKEEVATIGFIIEIIACLMFTLLIYINYVFQVFDALNGIEVLVVLYMFTNAFGLYANQLAKGQEKVFEIGVSGILATIAAVSLNVYFLLYLKLGFIGFFLAGVLAHAISIFYLLFSLKFWNLIKINLISKRLTKEMVAYSLPVILTNIGWWVNGAADKYTVTFFCGISLNGLLAISYKIPTIINTVQTIFMQAWQISAIKEYENGDTFYKQMFEYFNLLMCISCSILILLTRPLASFLYAKDFYNAWQYVPLLLVCSVINGAAGFIGPILAANKDSKTMAKSAIYGSITNILLNILLTYYIGVQGAIIATLISSYVMYTYRKSVIGDRIVSKLYVPINIVWFLLIIQCFIEIHLQNYLLELFVLASIIALLREPFCKCFAKGIILFSRGFR